MAGRRWTVMIVPHGSESARSIAVSDRALRAASWVGACISMVLLIGLGVVIAQVGSVGRRIAYGRSLDPAAAELLDLRAQIGRLQDTIAGIEQREERLRLMAGMPDTDSAERLVAMSAGDSGDGPPAARADVAVLLRRASLLSESFAEVTDSVSRHVRRLESTPSIMPTAGWLTSAFTRSRFHPILHVSRPHEGIDVSAPMGAPIVAPASGRVKTVTRERGYGNVLEIDHGNGIVTRFAHTSRIVVREGQRVTRGQLVANVGNSGLSTGPHLHYEIHVNGAVVDPLKYVLPADAIPD